MPWSITHGNKPASKKALTDPAHLARGRTLCVSDSQAAIKMTDGTDRTERQLT